MMEIVGGRSISCASRMGDPTRKDALGISEYNIGWGQGARTSVSRDKNHVAVEGNFWPIVGDRGEPCYRC